MPKLLLISLGRGDVASFQQTIVAARTAPGTVWDPGLLGFICFGSTDLAFLCKTDSAYAQAKDLLATINIVPGQQGISRAGWSRLYCCDLEALDGIKYATECHPFAYLILVHGDEDDRLISQTVEACSKSGDASPEELWKTTGYYRYCLITSRFSNGLDSTLGIRQNGHHTYSIPMASLDWITGASKRKLADHNETYAHVHIEANCAPGEEPQARQTLCQLLRTSQENQDRSSMPSCYLSHFRHTNGIKDLCTTTPIKVNLATLKQTLWEARSSYPFLAATRTYIFSDETFGPCEHTDNCHKAKPPRCAHLEDWPAKVAQGSEDRHGESMTAQIQPLKPFHVLDLAGGIDWSQKMAELRALSEKIVKAYDQTLDDANPEPDQGTKIDTLKARLRLVVEPGNDVPVVRDVKGHGGYTDVTFSNYTLSQEKIDQIAIHEFTVAVFRYLLLQIFTELPEGEQTPVEKPLSHDIFGMSLDELHKILWKMVGKPVAAAVNMINENIKVGDYVKLFLEPFFSVNPETGLRDILLQREYLHHMAAALFVVNRIRSSPESDGPNFHWQHELRVAEMELHEALKSAVDGEMPEINKTAIILGDELPEKIPLAGRAIFCERLSLLWLIGIKLGRNIVAQLGSSDEESLGNFLYKNTPYVASSAFLRFLLMGSYHAFKTVENVILPAMNDWPTSQETLAAKLNDLRQYQQRHQTIEDRLGMVSGRIWPPNLLTQPLAVEKDHTVLEEIPFSDILALANAEYLIKNGFPASNDSTALPFLAEVCLEPFYSFTDDQQQQCGGEFLANYTFPSAPGSQPPERKRFFAMLRDYVGAVCETSPRQYRPLEFARRMHLELLSLEGATTAVRNNDTSHKSAPQQLPGDENRQPQYITCNVTPWLFSKGNNPWLEEFVALYRSKMVDFVRAVHNRGMIPVLEITEGDILVEASADREKAKPFLHFLDSIRKEFTEPVGLAIDDQYGPGTDMIRLQKILNNVLSSEISSRFSPFIVKIHHQVVSDLLYLSDKDTLAKLNLDVLPKELHSESAIKINLLTQLISQTIKTHNDTLIVIEGYRGPDCFENQTRIKTNYQKMLQGIISSSLDAPEVLLGNTAILVQG